MSGWILREAAAGEAPDIVGVLQAAFREYLGRLDPPSGAHAETVETVRQRMTRATAVLALIEGVPAGCIFCEARAGHVYLSRLAVLPSYRRRGLGHALIEHVEARARTLGISRVRLGVRISLVEQRAYYERLGYRFFEHGYHEGYTEPTFDFLEKDLSQ
jgi:ribosomal protein S18 acetylase RimI-like enzyme